MRYSPARWQSWKIPLPKTKRRSSAEVKEQNDRNNAMAAEYKIASPSRRGEILREYYEGNKFWIMKWPSWGREHWEELTQIFVSYWHEAFMRYSPHSSESVFNFFMDRIYKATASQDYRRFITKESKNIDFEYSDEETGSGKKTVGNVRREFFVHPQSDFDRALLRSKLCRSLDKHEINIVERHFFEDEKIVDIVRDQLREAGTPMTIKQLSQASYNFKKKHYDAILDKLYLNVSKEELRELASQNDYDHPATLETVYNTKFRRDKYERGIAA